MRVLFFVTHLLGTGHLSRVLTLARAFAVRGHDAHVVSGGMPVSNLATDGVKLHQLPPVRSDGVNFTTLLLEDGRLADEPYLQRRKDMMLSLMGQVQPEVLITELFPFGRRVLKGEFLALLNGSRLLAEPPIVLCSIRDILAPPSKPKKALETEAVIGAYYDGVLAHSDAELMPLDLSWPVSRMLQEKLHYTGFVAPPPAGPHPDGIGKDEVLVTAGGGDVGMALFRAAMKAAALRPDWRWRILVGGRHKMVNISALKGEVESSNVIVESTRPDFRQMLFGAKAAVAMCGYNTAIDLLQIGTPAVFVPFDAGGEVEQTLRAGRLAEHVQFAVVPTAQAGGTQLLNALEAVVKRRKLPVDPAQFQGAKMSVEIVESMLDGRRDG